MSSEDTMIREFWPFRFRNLDGRKRRQAVNRCGYSKIILDHIFKEDDMMESQGIGTVCIEWSRKDSLGI